MKIGLFTHVSYPFTNGVAISVEQLAKSLREHNHDVVVISNNDDLVHNDFSDTQKIKAKSIAIFYQNLRTPILLNPKLSKELSKIGFDVVHSHSDFGQAFIARSYSLKHHIPLIHTYHSNYLKYAEENFGKNSPYLFYGPVKYYTRMLCSTADRMIVPSKEIEQLLNKRFHVKKKLDVIPNGIDLLKFDAPENTRELKEKLGIKEDDFVILSLSRLSKEKRIDQLLYLLPLLQDCEKLKLLIVGSGPDEKRLKFIVQNLNLHNVIFTGEIPYEKVQDYYALANLFVTNSLSETQGLTVIEALASSIPVICPHTRVFEEVINDFNGFMFRNYDELVNIIRICYDNKEELLPIKKEARLSAQRFAINKSVRKIETIYQEEHEKVLERKAV